MSRIFRLLKKHELVKWLVLDKASYERVSRELYRHIDLKVVGQMVTNGCPMVSDPREQNDIARYRTKSSFIVQGHADREASQNSRLPF